MRLRGSFACLALLLISCSSRPATTPQARVSPAPSRSASVAPAPSELRVGKVAPPVIRLFAGTQSAIGAPLRYCFKGSCVEGGSAPARLAVDTGSVVTVALGRAPERAVAELTGEGGGRSVLLPATLMAVPGKLKPGAHRVVLSLSWSDASGTWAFELLAK